MRKRMIIFLVIGIICLLSGIVMIKFYNAPQVIPTTMISIGVVSVILFIYTKGGTIILDEMVKRLDTLSGYYSFIASCYFICTLGIINYFFPLLLSTHRLLMAMMFFNGIFFIIIRQYLLRRGKTE
ncbi:hypothetical protein ACFL1R_02070 [Candidatus Latescibacterota bacterium]